MKIKKNIQKTLHILALAVIFILLIFPFYYMIITSFKFERDINVLPIQYFPSPATFENYITAWQESNFALYFFNTVILSFAVLVLVTVVSMMTGYALSRYNFVGKNVAMVLFLATQMVPGALLIIPMFSILDQLGLINTVTSVTLATSANLLAYCAIMMRGFFSNISVQIEQAAWIDGCNKFQAVVRVIFPLLLPGLVATGAYAFVNAWNSFLLPLILLTDPSKFTLTLGLKSLIGQYTINYGRLSAAGIISLIPAVILFAYIQKHMVAGLSAGAVKG